MADPKEQIAVFVKKMQEQNGDEVNKLDLPSGTLEYLQDLIDEGDSETLMFMLKLAWVMGLQTGFAAAQSGAATPPSSSPFGPMQA